jgi:hypothetical protein
VNGSFVCDTPEPNDIDCVLLLPVDYPKDESAADELLQGLPFIEIYLVESEDYNFFVIQFFAKDRKNDPKGMLEVAL